MKSLINYLVPFLLVATLHAQQQNSTILGKTDLNSLLQSAPELKRNPEEAFAYACNRKVSCQGDSPLSKQYDAFKKKSESYSTSLKEEASAKMESNYGGMNSSDMYADSKNHVNQNALIKQMGGVDKIMQMSDKEREVAARNAAAYNASNSTFSPFSEAEMKRMMNDPAYAKQMTDKYNKMSESEKAAFVKEKMAKYTKPVMVSKSDLKKQSEKIENVNNLIEINQFISETTSRLMDVFNSYDATIQKIKQSGVNHNELNKTHSELYKKIPLVVMGEGREPDPKKVRELNLTYALKHKERAASELSQIEVAFKDLNRNVIKIINDYNAFLVQNGFKVNDKVESIYENTNTEMALAQLEMSIGDSISKIAEISYTENTTASGHEQQYQYLLTQK